MSNDNLKDVQGRKRTKLSQSDIPRYALEKSLSVARALWDEFGGRGAEPLQLAIALNLAPTSGHWRNLCGSSIAYGLTEGGYNAKEIILTPTAKSILAPTEEGEDKQAIINAVLAPNFIRLFFEKYDKAKLPSETIAQNVLVSLGIPKERAKDAYDLIFENGRFSGIITETKTGYFVSISTASKIAPDKRANTFNAEPVITQISTAEQENIEVFARQISGQNQTVDEKIEQVQEMPKNNKVFISHGKNKQVVEQLKEILKFGRYEPIVCVENETISKPVPDKVLDDMRACFAGVINVHSEGELLDASGNRHIKINDNVLIEIGAAMALYDRNYVLLVQKGVQLPSNLQGLYRCEYEGEKLDYEATMKLLKTFNQFK